MTASLNLRLLAAASVGLAAFLGLAGLALYSAFTSRTEIAVQNRLQGQIFGLLAAADLDASDSLSMSEDLLDPRFTRADSGLYAQITDTGGGARWRSRSSMYRRIVAVDPPLHAGEISFARTDLAGGEPVFTYHMGISWDTPGGFVPLVFSVAEDVAGYEKEIAAFRRTLWIWLAVAGLVLLVLQALVLRWSLRPLAEVAAELVQIETGERDRLSAGHPREIESLAVNVNTLLANERSQRRRYRDTMDDLAHSIKTPLAVLLGWLDGLPDGIDKTEADRQLKRITQIIEHQLRRAISGSSTFAKPVAVRKCVEQVLSALRKVYHEKTVEPALDCAPDLAFFGDEGDLMEVLGNVLDNAFKYCATAVRVECREISGDKRSGLEIVVEDDGPGFGGGHEHRLVQRGVRADRRTSGQGIGLATVRDIVDAYRGELSLEQARGGGGRVVLRFPAV